MVKIPDEDTTFNIYCDESCHLEHDHHSAMVLGAIWQPSECSKEIASEIRNLKRKHGVGRDFEIKWTKVSPAKVDFYSDLVNYFFENENLHFRALVIPNKADLKHDRFQQTHDEWYYKMYFELLKVILNPESRYRIYLDIKDTRSFEKTEYLHDVLCNNMYDFSRTIIERLQTVRSHEVEQIQLTDLLIGAVSYTNRELNSSNAKGQIIDLIRRRSGYQLNKTTLLKENKFNLFIWEAAK